MGAALRRSAERSAGVGVDSVLVVLTKRWVVVIVVTKFR